MTGRMSSLRFLTLVGLTCTIVLVSFFIFQYLLSPLGNVASKLLGIGDNCLHQGCDIISSNDLGRFKYGYDDLDNDRFHEYIRKRWLVGPASLELPWILKNPDQNDYSQVGQSSFVDRLLEERKNGFFVECGAGDGETISNTLFFEKNRGWKGLLIEPNPVLFESMLSKQRKAYTINVCLSGELSTEIVNFKPAGDVGGIPEKMAEAHMRYVKIENPADITVTCIPLYAILKTIGIKHVDYFSLDVEGPELDILNTFPFNNITIDIISIEYRVWDMEMIQEPETSQKLTEIRNFFTKLGNYEEVGILPRGSKSTTKAKVDHLGLDVIFKRRH